jgi:hypothetical protein
MAIRTELTVRLLNSPGVAARVCAALADDRINILALQLEAGGVMRLLVDNPLHAAELLRERRFQVEEREVLYTTLPNGPGALGRLGLLLADAGINVEYLYATAVEGHPLSAVVIGVPDARRASAASGI